MRAASYLTPEPNVTYSACLVGKVEEMFASGKAPYPVERTLLVSGMLESCLTSRGQDHKRIDTPHLQVKYQAPRESQHARTPPEKRETGTQPRSQKEFNAMHL